MRSLLAFMLVLLLGSVFFQFHVIADLIKAVEITRSMATEGQVNKRQLIDMRSDLRDVSRQAQELKKEVTGIEHSLAEYVSAQQAQKYPTKAELMKDCDDKLSTTKKELVAMIKRRREPIAK